MMPAIYGTALRPLQRTNHSTPHGKQATVPPRAAARPESSFSATEVVEISGCVDATLFQMNSRASLPGGRESAHQRKEPLVFCSGTDMTPHGLGLAATGPVRETEYPDQDQGLDGSPMTDPAMLAVATAASAAMAGTYAQAMGDASREAMSALVAKIRQRFRERPEDEAILGAVVDDPEAVTARQALAEALVRITAEDPVFLSEILELGHRAGVQIPERPHTTNIVNAGSIGKMISAGGDIHVGGDLSL